MQIIRGRVESFLDSCPGQINGFVLDSGIEVRFSSAESSRVSSLIEIGSPVEIRGWTRPAPAGEMEFEAASIKNSDSNQIVHVEHLPLPHDPEVPPPSIATEEAASLPPLPREQGRRRALSGKSFGFMEGLSGSVKESESFHSQSSNVAEKHPADTTPSNRWINREEAAKEIENAYDALHRTQAILAYVKIVDLKDPDVGQLLEEARRCYEQALSIYQRADFAADELAAASRNLSAAAENVVSQIFRSSSLSPTLVPPPPLHQTTPDDSAQVLDRILRTQKSLSRIRWLLENGTMPQEEMEEVQKVSAWSEGYFQRAQRAFHAGRIEESAELAGTAYAVAQAAEHICRKCYVERVSGSRSTVVTQPSD